MLYYTYNVPEEENVLDVDIANDILVVIDNSAVATPDDVFRIGKPSPGKPRLLKVRFKQIETCRMVLRKRAALKNTNNFSKIFISNDRTRKQQEYFKMIQNKIDTRKNNGEKDL